MRRWRLGAVLAAAVGAVFGLVSLGGGFVYANQLLPAPSRDRTLDMRATVTRDGTILLPPERRACLEAFAMLLEDDALVLYGGPIVAGTCGPEVTQPVERTIERVLLGSPRIGVEVGARFDEYAGLADPGDVGLAFSEVDVPLVPPEDGGGEANPLGLDPQGLGEESDGVDSAPAWRVDGSDDWVILVHGRSATRAEALRLLPTVTESGASALVVTYRNDMAGAPVTFDAVGRFGQTEWVDLQAAVAYARAEGARRIVLAGFSQGGSLISYYLRNAGEAEVDGVILDSPLLSLPDTLVQQARLRGIPGPLIPPILFATRTIAGLRSDFEIDDVDHVEALSATTVPMLLIHGDEDDFVPNGPSGDLAAARPRGLVYERIEGAGHVEGWNTDREQYAGLVSAFLSNVFD